MIKNSQMGLERLPEILGVLVWSCVHRLKPGFMSSQVVRNRRVWNRPNE